MAMAASSPQFFRIILHSNLQDRKLVIPKKFVKDYGKFLSRSSEVRLKLQDGMNWKVGLKMAANGGVWMQKGWHEFAEHYGLDFGSMLVFRLHGNATFQTTIFDPTGLETEYSCSNFRGDFENQDSDFDFDSDSDESLESFPRHSKKRKNASSVPRRQSQSRKKLRNDDSLLSPKIEPEEERCNIFRDMMPRRRQQSANKAETTQRFRSRSKSKTKSEKQPTFKVVMSKSNVRGRFDLIFPKEFANKYLSNEFGVIELQTSNGRNWPVVYKWSRNRGNFAYISMGWKIFVEENLLKEGDIGFFQLIKKDKFLFTKLQETPLPKKRIASVTTTRRRNHPFFEVDILFKSYKNFSLNVPLGFAREHLSAEMQFAKLRIGNKEWNVTLKQYESSVRFSAGWSIFYDDNGLEDRDTCIFEMVNKKDCVFQVTISKKLTSSASMD